MMAFVSALLTRTETAPPTAAPPSLPATAPASAWAPRSPLYLPVVFWLRLALTVTSPSLPRSGVSPSLVASFCTSTVDSLRLTLTATPAAMALLPSARDMAIPVPRVRKFPSLLESTLIPPAALILPLTLVLTLCLEMVRPTAAATWTLLFWSLPFTPMSLSLAPSASVLASLRSSFALDVSVLSLTLWVLRTLVERDASELALSPSFFSSSVLSLFASSFLLMLSAVLFFFSLSLSSSFLL